MKNSKIFSYRKESTTPIFSFFPWPQYFVWTEKQKYYKKEHAIVPSINSVDPYEVIRCSNIRSQHTITSKISKVQKETQKKPQNPLKCNSFRSGKETDLVELWSSEPKKPSQ